MDEIASIQHETVPRSINRMQQLNSVKISAVPMGPIDGPLSWLENEARQMLPKNYTIDHTGESRQLRREGNTLWPMPAFSFAMVMIFLVLAAQYNSFRDPIVILAGSVPLALFGALILPFKNPRAHALYTDAFTCTMNIYSQVGLVTLVGLIARNGILVVEFANRLQEQGLEKIEAIRQAAVVRLRPVLMTSIATIAGHTPLILPAAQGAEARNSIGLVLVFGMTIGTIMTLFVLPAVYVLIAGITPPIKNISKNSKRKPKPRA